MKTLLIADIHGQFEKLLRVLDIAGFDPAVDRFIGLGDYIDYGPDSLKVLDWLCDLRKEKRHVFLAGNHENFIYLMVMHSRVAYLETWLQNGGEATLKGYDWDPAVIRWIGENPGAAARLWYKDDAQGRTYSLDKDGIAHFIEAIFPLKHLDFIINLEERHRIDEYVLSHDAMAESERKNRVNIHAHDHAGLQVGFRRINIAAKHGEVGCLVLDDLSWYSSDGDYLEVDLERLYSPGSDKSLEDILKDQAMGESNE